jgi:hypothetical protein
MLGFPYPPRKGVSGVHSYMFGVSALVFCCGRERVCFNLFPCFRAVIPWCTVSDGLLRGQFLARDRSGAAFLRIGVHQCLLRGREVVGREWRRR